MTPAEIRKARCSWRYGKMRRRFLTENPLCQVCEKEGYTVAAAEIDHVIPVEKDPDRFWDESNWEPICRSCHVAKTAKENRLPETPGQKAWRERVEAMR